VSSCRALLAALVLVTVGPGQTHAPKLDLALKDAKTALHSGDTSKAMEILRKADSRVRDPKAQKLLSYAYQMRGREYFEAKKMDLAYRSYFAANRITPGQASVLQSLGVITFKLKRSREAETYMKRVLKKNPGNAQALAILGAIAEKRDNVGAASKYYKRAAKQSPERQDYRAMATKLGREAKVEEKFVTLDKGNFRVQIERGKHVGVEKAVRSVHQYLEQAYRDLTKELGASPRKRITVVIYNKTQYRRVSNVHSWARAYFDGKVRVAIQRWPGDREALRKDLRHELTHAFLRGLHPRTPTWLHEGLAQVIEGRDARGAASLFRNGKYKVLPIRTLLGNFTDTKDAETANVGYAQALALVGYLKLKGGRRQLQSLLRGLDRSGDSKKALRLVYGKSIEELMKAALKRVTVRPPRTTGG
jgi:tetratricopeptide (TPR) repeat protein